MREIPLTKKEKKRRKQIAKKKPQIEIRQMAFEELSEVWHIGGKIFTPSRLQFT